MKTKFLNHKFREKIVKPLISLTIACVSIVNLSGCGNISQEDAEEQAKILLLTNYIVANGKFLSDDKTIAREYGNSLYAIKLPFNPKGYWLNSMSEYFHLPKYWLNSMCEYFHLSKPYDSVYVFDMQKLLISESFAQIWNLKILTSNQFPMLSKCSY